MVIDETFDQIVDAFSSAEIIFAEYNLLKSAILGKSQADICHRWTLELAATELEQGAGLVAGEEFLQVDELFLVLIEVVA